MDCKFKRDGEYLKCDCCGSSIKTKSDKVRMNCKGGDGCVKPEYPSVFQMTVNATVAAAEYIADGMVNVDDKEQERRLEICRGCEEYDKEQNRCYKCGCYLSLKTEMRSGHCPLSKW